MIFTNVLDTVAKWSGPSPLSCAIWGFCDIVRKWMGGGGGGGGGLDQENLFLGIDKKRNP